MHATNLPKVGGSVMMAVPPAILELLDLKVGAPVGIDVEAGRLTVQPRPRPHYSLAELLAQCDPAAFNRLTRLPIVLPITSSSDFARMGGFAVSLMGAGTKSTGVVRCDQPPVLDLAARKGRKLERVPEFVLDEVLARLAPLFA